MFVSAYFNRYHNNIQKQLLKELMSAQRTIYIASSWFTDRTLLEVLSHKIQNGVKVCILVIDDSVNRTENSVSFNEFLKVGGKVYFRKVQPRDDSELEIKLMHHKFCVIDTLTVITGSYNWTFTAKNNDENIVVIKNDIALASNYIDEFCRLCPDVTLDIVMYDNDVLMQHGLLTTPQVIDETNVFLVPYVRIIDTLKPYNITYGFCTLDKALIIPFQFEFACPFSEDLAVVKTNFKWGYINKIGQVVIPCVYDHAFDFNEGMALVVIKKLINWVGYIDKAGRTIAPCIYCDGHEFIDGFATVAKISNIRDNDSENGYFASGLWGTIDTEGNEVIPFIYDEKVLFSDGLAGVSKNCYNGLDYDLMKHKAEREASSINFNCGFIDKNGRTKIDFKYCKAKSFSEGLAAVKVEDKWGYINTKDKIVIPLIYDDALSFSEGLAAVEKNNKWGYIDKLGNVVIPFIFDSADNFSDGLAAVDNIGYINKDGSLEIEIGREVDSLFQFKDGIGGYYTFDAGGCYENDSGVHSDDGGEYFTFINKLGEDINNEIYQGDRECHFYFKNGLIGVRKNLNPQLLHKYGHYNRNVNFYIDKSGTEYLELE